MEEIESGENPKFLSHKATPEELIKHFGNEKNLTIRKPYVCMKKIFENLKPGDICYCLDTDNKITEEKNESNQEKWKTSGQD